MSDESFDMIYIDGDHTYDKFVGDLEEADRLLKLEGVMCRDDLELHSHQVDIDYAVLNENRNWGKDPKKRTILSPRYYVRSEGFLWRNTIS
mgnify:CR=1 FL=1